MHKYQLNCEVCQAQFGASRKHATICSKKCNAKKNYYKKPKFVKNCALCKKEKEFRCEETQYCRACVNTLTKKHNDVILVCEYCRIEFVKPYIERDRKFCSVKCSNQIKSGENHHWFGMTGSLSSTYGQTPWLKGLSAKTDEKVAALGQKISLTLKEKFASGERSNTGENNPMFGRKHSLKTREKMSEEIEKRWHQRRGSYFKGVYFSLKNNIEMNYRSSWELVAMRAMDQDENIIKFISEPFSLKYKQKKDEIHRKYYPDFQVFYKDGTIKIIEIKPEFYMQYEINQSKFNAAKIFCQEKGFIFEVWHAEHINKLKEILSI